MLGIITNLIIIVVLFSACIFVHELGHFLAAMWRGLRIEKFAIGFGPKIWGFTRQWTDRYGDKQHTEFNICWLPFGGYVMLPQISPLDEKHLAEYNPPLRAVRPLDKIITAVAGPFFNVIFAFLIALVVMVIGIPVDKSEMDLRVGYVPADSAEAQAGLRQGDKIIEVNGRRVEDWNGVEQAVAFSLSHDVELTVLREGQPLKLKVTPDRMPVFKIRRLYVGPPAQAMVARVIPNTPAAEAGLQVEDRILQVDGIDVIGMVHLLDLIGERAGKPTKLLVARGDQKFTVDIVPRLEATTQRGKIGIQPTDVSDAGMTLIHPGPVTQVKKVVLMMSNTIAALMHPKQTGVTPGDLSGPVGIGQILWITIARGLVFALSFMVLININLAILNMLPVPVLDGGHVLFALVEAVRRRPLSYRVASVIQTTFAALLITFIVYITYNDILRLFHFSRMKPRPVDKMEFVEPVKEAPADEPAAAPAP